MKIALMIQYFDFETLMNEGASLMKSEKSKMVFGIFWLCIKYTVTLRSVCVFVGVSKAIIRFVIRMCEYEGFHNIE